MLSAWLDLIERGKVVALHDSIKSFDEQERSIHEPGTLYEDENTGAMRIEAGVQDPWQIVPFAKQDLLDTLDAWHALIKAIDEKSPEPRSEPFGDQGLFGEEVLQAAEIRKNGFAWKFFTHAWKPCSDILFLGPGLRLPTDKELISNAWSNADDPAAPMFPQHWIGDIVNWPVPILLGSRQAMNWLD